MLLGAGGQSSSAASSNMSTVIGSNFAPPSMAQGVSQDVQLASSMEPPSDGQLYKSYCDATGTDPTAWAISASHSSLITNSSAASQEGKYLDSFYHHFHASHPFVLPKAFLLQVAKEGTIKPLLAAIWWLGSIYIDVNSGTRERLLNQAYELLYDSGQPRDAFVVQAMMLMIVGLDGNCQQEKARVLLGEAETLALKIGLNTREFATEHGRGIPVVEESWRRTWWDLFIIDGMIAGVHRQTNFLLYDIPAGAGLPCEEDQYLSTVSLHILYMPELSHEHALIKQCASQRIPIPLYLEDMEDQFFSDDDREFSSFAYRVQCGRNLGKMMRTPPMFGPDDENLAKIETLLTNWRLHLPASKRDALQKNGKLDEMMFQAHMMNQATSIMLHQPHSQLDSSATQDINSCAPHQMIPSGDLFNKHTRHTVESANTISNMITHRVPLLSHTHFFTCVITLSSIVHLSRWALIFIPHDDDDLRQKIRLNIGALNRLSEVWGAADRARGQVKAVAQEIYKVKKQQRDSSEYWLGLSQQEITNTITTDDSIISEFDTFQPMPSTLLN